MDVREAHAFLAVAEELHFGRAAERLHIAQPPLSRTIRNLERAYGTALFDRTTRTVSLTPAGRALLPAAQRLADAAADVDRIMADVAAGRTGRIRLGFASTSNHRHVGRLARRVKADHPGLALELHSAQFSHQGFSRVMDGRLDLAIGRWDHLPPELDSVLLRREEVLIALPADHRLAHRDEVAFAELADEDWIVLPTGVSAALHHRFTSLSLSAGVIPRVTETAPDSWTMLVLVAAGNGVGFSMETVRDNAHHESGVRFVRLSGPANPMDMRMIWRRDHDSAALRSVVQASVEVLQEHDDGSPASASPGAGG